MNEKREYKINYIKLYFCGNLLISTKLAYPISDTGYISDTWFHNPVLSF